MFMYCVKRRILVNNEVATVVLKNVSYSNNADYKNGDDAFIEERVQVHN